MDTLNAAGVSSLPYPLQRQLVKNLTAFPDTKADLELLTLWAGQSANLAHGRDFQTFLQKLVGDVTGI